MLLNRILTPINFPNYPPKFRHYQLYRVAVMSVTRVNYRFYFRQALAHRKILPMLWPCSHHVN
ncbi:hypothetical protein ALT1644_350016 [Alteromonas macleodii]